MLLTPETIRAAAPRTAVYRLNDGNGLSVQIRPDGAKHWRFRYKYRGVEKMLSLGRFGDGSKRDEVTLRAARLEADRLQALIAAGTDPGALRREEKRRRQLVADTNFQTVALTWWEHWRGTVKPLHAERVRERLQADVFPTLGATPVDEIKAAAVLMMLRKIEARGVVTVAGHVLITVAQVMRYAVANGLAERNPCSDLKASEILKRAPVKNRARVTERELPDLLKAINRYDGRLQTRYALLMLAHTFTRPLELIGATWGEIDAGNALWRIPAERMKDSRPHLVPLSRQVLAILGEMRTLAGGQPDPSAFVFPGRDGRGRMGINSLLSALYAMGYRGRMTAHGFRGIASTALHERGFQPELIELQLAHLVGNAVSRAYNHAQFLQQRADMLQSWSDYLDGLTSGANVVPIFRNRTA